MPKRELSKCRVWERERRERLKTCFEALDRVLPNHDPAVTSSKLEILQRAASHITELQRKNKELVLGDVQIQSTAQRDEVRRLRERVRKLSARAEQLAGLLRAAGLRVPKECVPTGVFRGPPRLWSGRVSKEKAEQLRTQHEQENDPKLTETYSPDKTNKRKRITSPVKKSGKNGDLETVLSTPISKKVAFSSRNNNNSAKRTNGVNRRRNSTSRPTVSNSSTISTTTTTQLSTNGVAARVAAVLGPGTLILANGSVVPVPAPRVTSTITASRPPLPATLQRIQLVPVTTAAPPPVILMQRSSNINNNALTSKFTNIQPKTASSKINRPNLPRKVPIPVLRSSHSISSRKHSLLQQRKENKLKAITKSTSISETEKGSTTGVMEKRTTVISSTTTTTVTVTKSTAIKQKQIKTDSIPSECIQLQKDIAQKNENKLQEISPVSTNSTNVNISKSNIISEVPEKNNLLEGINLKSDKSTENLSGNKYTSECAILKQNESNTSVPSSELKQQKQKISIIKIEKLSAIGTTLPNIENKVEKELQKQSQEQENQIQKRQENVQQIKHELQVDQCRSQLQSMHTEEEVQSNQLEIEQQQNQLQTTEHQTNQLQINQIDHQDQHQSEQLNDQHPDEHHSELSNDIFASLQDGTGTGVMGSQHTESMSPTAAFLLAFPLVSTLTGSGRGTDPTAHGSTNSDGRTLNGTSSGNGNNNNSDDDRQGTPTTLLQIGGNITLDNTNNNKQRQVQPNEEVPRNLDSFAYFSTRDNQQYSSIRDHASASLEPIVSNNCLYEQQPHIPPSSQQVALSTIGYNNDTTDTYSNNLFTELRNTNTEHQQQTNQNQHQTVYSSCLAKEKLNSKQRTNKNQQQQQQQYRAPVNWMTSPDVRPTYTHQHYQHASTPSSLGTSDYFLPPFSDVYGSNSGSLDHNTTNDHPPFTWSPTTARSTLPTLIGDLALGVNPPSNNHSQSLEQQQMEHQSKDITNPSAPFLSVSSLVNGSKQNRNKQQSTQQTKRHREKTNKSRVNNNVNTSNTINITNATTSSTNTIASNSSIITTSYMSNVNTSTKRPENSSYIISGNSNMKRSDNTSYINNSIKRIDNSLYIDNNVNNNLKRSDTSYINNNVTNSKRTGNISYMDNINSNMKRNENTSYNDNNIKRSVVGGYSAEALISSDNTNMQNHLHQSAYSSAYNQRINNYVLPSTIVPSNNGCVIDSSQQNNNQHIYQSHQNNQPQIQSNHLQQHSQHQHHSNIHNSTSFPTNIQHRQSHSLMNSNNNTNQQSHPPSSQHISPSSFSNITSSTATFTQMTPSLTFTQMTPTSTFTHMTPTTSVSLPNMIISSSTCSSFPHMTSTATSTFSHMNSSITTSSSFGHMPPSSFSHHPPPPAGEFSALLSAAVVDTYSKTFDSFVHAKPPVPPPSLVSTLAMTTVTSSVSTSGNFGSYCGSNRNDVIIGSSSHNPRSHITSNVESERRRHSSSRRTGNNNSHANTSVAASTFSELSFLTMSGAVSSPLLPDDYHSATAFLSNAAPSVPVPPPMPPTASSLTNFNLSAIFPEINKATSSLPISTWSSSAKTSVSSSRSQNRYHHQNQSHHQNNAHSHQQQPQRNSNNSVQSNSVNTSGYRQQHHEYHQQFQTNPMYVASSNSNNTNTSSSQFASMLPHHQVQAFNGANSTGNSISTNVPGSGVDISTAPASATFSFSFTTP